MGLTHLRRLEAESIHIMREAMADAINPVMLYSVGKDSTVMLRLAFKAFYPGKPPFRFLHIDTTWNFHELIEFREKIATSLDIDIIAYINKRGVEEGVTPFSHGSANYTDVMNTQALRQALDLYKFDVAFGGGRRDEEKSRAKERIFSIRTAQHRWDPKLQRPELWRLYNGRKSEGESVRVFPLSNWTELDIWRYIEMEDIPVVSLYFAKERPVVTRQNMLIVVDDDRMPLAPGEVVSNRMVRFRTLGCYPQTAAIESEAKTIRDIICETEKSRLSERQGRLVDLDATASMERKKTEGYY